MPPSTARLVEATRGWGGRVVAVGTTVVRALETVARADGTVEAGEGWTALVVTPERGVRIVDGLLTGWHEPEASHLDMLEAIAGRALVERSYAAALAGRLSLARVRRRAPHPAVGAPRASAAAAKRTTPSVSSWTTRPSSSSRSTWPSTSLSVR